MRADIKQLRPHLYLINDAGSSTCYLLCGRDKAAVIDTVNGQEDLLAIVRTLTDLPLVVINTHGHGDHIFGNGFFEEAYMHPADNAIAELHFGFLKMRMGDKALMPCPFKPLQVGDVFDLGGVTLETVDLKGHTPGSIGLIDKEDRILFSGDGLNTHIWMQLQESSSIAQLRETLLALKEQHGEEFDIVLTGHAKETDDKIILDQMIAGCDRLIAGQRETDQPYHWFGGDCLAHPLSDRPGHAIIFDESKL